MLMPRVTTVSVRSASVGLATTVKWVCEPGHPLFGWNHFLWSILRRSFTESRLHLLSASINPSGDTVGGRVSRYTFTCSSCLAPASAAKGRTTSRARLQIVIFNTASPVGPGGEIGECRGGSIKNEAT